MSMRDHQLARIASEQHGTFTLAQAIACGLPNRTLEHRIERGQYLVLHPRVYALAGSPGTWHREVVAGALSVNAGAAVSHQTAAYLWDMTGRRGSGVEVVTTARTSQRWTAFRSRSRPARSSTSAPAHLAGSWRPASTTAS